jgi:stage V sporulation protein AC
LNNLRQARKNRFINNRLQNALNKEGIFVEVTGQEYRKLSDQVAPRSPVLKNCIKAFLIGGLICAIGQIITGLVLNTGLGLKDARLIGSSVLIALSAILTALNLYDDIAKHAGAGTLVPITGFANSIVAPAIEFKSEGLIIGLAAKMFTIAGPVLVYGITASIIYGLILNLVTMFK